MNDVEHIGLMIDEAVNLAPAIEKAARAEAPDHIEDIVRTYASLRSLHDALKSLSSTLGNAVNAWNYGVVPDAMREAGVTTVTVAGVGRVSLTTRTSCSMTDKEGGMQWLRDNNHGDIIQETVNSSTLGAFAKSMLEEGFELPDDKFKTTVATGTSLTRAK